MQERVDDYLKFGVPYVWIVDPSSSQGVALHQRRHTRGHGIPGPPIQTLLRPWRKCSGGFAHRANTLKFLLTASFVTSSCGHLAPPDRRRLAGNITSRCQYPPGLSERYGEETLAQ